jgi:hypothetical protein
VYQRTHSLDHRILTEQLGLLRRPLCPKPAPSNPWPRRNVKHDIHVLVARASHHAAASRCTGLQPNAEGLNMRACKASKAPKLPCSRCRDGARALKPHSRRLPLKSPIAISLTERQSTRPSYEAQFGEKTHSLFCNVGLCESRIVPVAGLMQKHVGACHSWGQDRVPGSAVRQRRYPNRITSTPSSGFPANASMPCIAKLWPAAPARNGQDRDQHGPQAG